MRTCAFHSLCRHHDWLWPKDWPFPLNLHVTNSYDVVNFYAGCCLLNLDQHLRRIDLFTILFSLLPCNTENLEGTFLLDLCDFHEFGDPLQDHPHWFFVLTWRYNILYFFGPDSWKFSELSIFSGWIWVTFFRFMQSLILIFSVWITSVIPIQSLFFVICFVFSSGICLSTGIFLFSSSFISCDVGFRNLFLLRRHRFLLLLILFQVLILNQSLVADLVTW